MSLPIYNYLTYKGKSTRDFGVGISGPGVWNAPERDIESVSIPGRDGDLLIDNGRYRNIEVKYPAYIARGFNEKFDDFRDFMYSEPNYYKLQDTYHPEEFRLGILRNGVEAEPGTRNLSGRFDMVFDCKPQRFLSRGYHPQLFIPYIQGDLSETTFVPVAATDQWNIENGTYISTPWIKDIVDVEIKIAKQEGTVIAGLNYQGEGAPRNQLISLPSAAGTYSTKITTKSDSYSWKFFIEKTTSATVIITINDYFGYYQENFDNETALSARFDYSFLKSQIGYGFSATAPPAGDDNYPNNVPFVAAGMNHNCIPAVYLYGLKGQGTVFVDHGTLYPLQIYISYANMPNDDTRMMIDFDIQNAAFQRQVDINIPMGRYMTLTQYNDPVWDWQSASMKSFLNVVPEFPKLTDGLKMTMLYRDSISDTPFSYGIIFTREWVL